MEEKRDTMVRRLCFTLNNYTEEELNSLRSLVKSNYFTYFLAGYEMGESGTPHIQGYGKLTTRKRWSLLKKDLPSRCHLEAARGSEKDNIRYIKYNEQKGPFNCFLEYGEPGNETGGQAYEVKEWLEQGLTLKDLLADPSFSVSSQTIRLFDRLSPLYSPKRDFKPEVIWVYGKPGAGKSSWVKTQEGDKLYVMQLDRKWFDGYNNHEAVLWDDFDNDTKVESSVENDRHYQQLLSLCDRGEFRAPVKGGSVQILAKRIYIVAKQPPWQLWLPKASPYNTYDYLTPPQYDQIMSNDLLSQVMRRLTNIKHIKLSTTKKLVFPEVEHIVHGDPEENPILEVKEKETMITRVAHFIKKS